MGRACYRARAGKGLGQCDQPCAEAGPQPRPRVTGCCGGGRDPGRLLSTPNNQPHRDTCQGGRPVVRRSPPAGAGRGADTAANEKGGAPRGGGLRRGAGTERGREAACLDAAAASGRDEDRCSTCIGWAGLVSVAMRPGGGADAAASSGGAGVRWPFGVWQWVGREHWRTRKRPPVRGGAGGLRWLLQGARAGTPLVESRD